MLKNLKVELLRNNITLKSLAEFLNVNEKTAQNKLKGMTAFTYPEVIKIQKFLLPQYNLEYLFAKDVR